MTVDTRKARIRLLAPDQECSASPVWEGVFLRRRYSKKVLWDIWFAVNWAKVAVLRVRLRISKNYWERQLSKFLEECWARIDCRDMDF